MNLMPVKQKCQHPFSNEINYDLHEDVRGQVEGQDLAVLDETAK